MSQKRFFFSLLCHGVSEVSHFLSVTLPSCRPPVRAQLSQPEEECVPARPLPPHQPHPFCPRLPLRPSFTMIHTQRESSSPLVFFFFFSSLSPSILLLILLTVSLGGRTDLPADQCPREHSQTYEHMFNLPPGFGLRKKNSCPFRFYIPKKVRQERTETFFCIIMVMSCPQSFYIPS